MQKEDTKDASAFAGRIDIILFLLLLSLCVLISFLSPKQSNMLCFILGFGIGCIVYFSDPAYALHTIGFDETFFFYAVVPPLVFSESFAMRKRKFFGNFPTAALLGVGLTLFFAILAGNAVFYMGQWGWISGLHVVNPMESLIYGTILTMTEGASLIEPDDHLDLHCVLFGENVVGDPTTIALFTAFRKFTPKGDDHSFTSATVLAIASQFLQVLIFSALIGTAAGLACAFLLKRLGNRGISSAQGEIAFLFTGAYLAYMLGEILDLSGAVAIFACAIVMAHYCFFTIRTPAQVTTAHFSANMAFIAEKFIYCYIGLNIMVLRDRYKVWASPAFIGLSFLLSLIIRGALLIPLALIANCFRRQKLHAKEVFAMWWLGQLRGAVSFAVALNTTSPNHGIIVTAIVTIVALSMGIVGAPSNLFLRMLGFKKPEADRRRGGVLQSRASAPYEILEDNLQEQEDERDGLLGGGGVEGVEEEESAAVGEDGEREARRSSAGSGRSGRRAGGAVHSRWRSIDDRFLRPLFGGAGAGSGVAEDWDDTRSFGRQSLQSQGDHIGSA